jgi:hypothetical protein
MSNGIKIGLLVVIAAALGIVAFKIYNNGNDSFSRPAEAGPHPMDGVGAGTGTGGAAPGELSKQRAKTTVKWETKEHDFGTINEGDEVEYSFKFTNTGSEPLYIESAKGSCGCTVPQKPEGPVQPGASDEIKVKFNSAGKKKDQAKTVTLTANTEEITTILTIKSYVNPKEGSEDKSH